MYLWHSKVCLIGNFWFGKHDYFSVTEIKYWIFELNKIVYTCTNGRVYCLV